MRILVKEDARAIANRGRIGFSGSEVAFCDMLGKVAGQWLAVDRTIIFSDQYNTYPIPDVSEHGLRVMEDCVDAIDFEGETALEVVVSVIRSWRKTRSVQYRHRDKRQDADVMTPCPCAACSTQVPYLHSIRWHEGLVLDYSCGAWGEQPARRWNCLPVEAAFPIAFEQVALGSHGDTSSEDFYLPWRLSAKDYFGRGGELCIADNLCAIHDRARGIVGGDAIFLRRGTANLFRYATEDKLYRIERIIG